MSIFPDRGPTPKQQEILARCPLVNTYLRDIRAIATDTSGWFQDIENYTTPLRNKLVAQIGIEGTRATYITAFAVLTALNMFHPDESEIDNKNLVEDLILMGLEMKSNKDIAAMSLPISNRVLELQMVNPSFISMPDGPALSRLVIMSLVLTGSTFHHTRSTEENNLKIFRTFINGLPNDPKDI